MVGQWRRARMKVAFHSAGSGHIHVDGDVELGCDTKIAITSVEQAQREYLHGA